MAKSLKDKFNSLRNRYLIDDAEYRSMCNKLDRHDSELLDKVAEKMKAEVNVCKNCMIVDCDTEYFKPMCEKADKGFIVAEVEEIVDEVIKELKAEVRE